MRLNCIPAAHIAALIAALIALAGCGGNENNNGVQTFTQVDRVGKPGVNTMFATVANNRHQTSDTDSPSDDSAQLASDIKQFMTHAAGRSTDIANAAAGLLSPNMLVVDLSKPGLAGYLGVETNGVVGSSFGGRGLSEDVMDTNLGIAFGSTIPNLGHVVDDGAEVAALTTDNVTAHTDPKHFQDGSAGFGAAVFPYLGPPQ